MAYDIKQSFLNLARYNERVNQEMVAVLAVLTGRARRQEAGSWFGSIHGILDGMGLAHSFADNAAYLEGQ